MGAAVGGRALWGWPAAFVAMIVAGFSTAVLGMQLPFVEPAIASSIVVLGLFVALTVQAPVWLGAVIPVRRAQPYSAPRAVLWHSVYGFS
jgi:urease accessory protein